jgi:hypothetical protein
MTATAAIATATMADTRELMPPELSGKFYFVFLPFSYWHSYYR